MTMQLMIIYIDCYSVHIGEAFRTYIWTGFPYLFLCFIPTNCKWLLSYCTSDVITNWFNTWLGTWKAQPADVGLNCVIKHQLKQSQLQHLINFYQVQIASGLTPTFLLYSLSCMTPQLLALWRSTISWQVTHKEDMY